MNIQDLEHWEFPLATSERSLLPQGGTTTILGPGGEQFTVTLPKIELLSMVQAFSFPVGIDLGQFANVQAGTFSFVRASSNVYVRNVPIFFA